MTQQHLKLPAVWSLMVRGCCGVSPISEWSWIGVNGFWGVCVGTLGWGTCNNVAGGDAASESVCAFSILWVGGLPLPITGTEIVLPSSFALN